MSKQNKIVEDQRDAQLVSDKWASYEGVYHSIWDRYQDRDVRIVEVGIQNGGSLQAFEKKLPRLSKAIGIDIDEKVIAVADFLDKSEIIIGDCNSHDTVKRVKKAIGKCDVFIDDGSHNSNDIIRCLLNYIDLVNDDGTYLIEDLHCSYFNDYSGGLYYEHSSLSFLKLVIDYINRGFWNSIEPASNLFNPFIKTGLMSREDIPKLDRIESIEFRNSLAIIRLGDPGLGKRIVAGQLAMVCDLLPHVAEGKIFDWSNQAATTLVREKSPVHDTKSRDALIVQLEEKNLQYRSELVSVYDSRSWKMTAILRKTKRAFDKIFGISDNSAKQE